MQWLKAEVGVSILMHSEHCACDETQLLNTILDTILVVLLITCLGMLKHV